MAVVPEFPNLLHCGHLNVYKVNQVTTWHSLVLNADGPVLVEFWAPWCGSCRMLHPVIGEIAQQYTGKLKHFKLNTDECPNIATQYGIRSVPTIMIFINGEKKETVIGAVLISALNASIENSCETHGTLLQNVTILHSLNIIPCEDEI